MCCVCFKTPINKGLFNNRVVKKYNKPPIMVEILETTNTIKNAISGRKMGRKFFEFSNFPEKSRKNVNIKKPLIKWPP